MLVSEFLRHNVLMPFSGVNQEKIYVFYQSCDLVFSKSLPLKEQNNPCTNAITCSSYIFCLGAEDSRNNRLRLVCAYLKLFKTNVISENLVISGYANWAHSDACFAVKEAGAEHRVKFLDFITINELSLFCRKATAFVYPSLYEGFGIPILEAFSSGCPVIASNVTSIPEVGGDAALYFDPLNESEITTSLLRVINDLSLRRMIDHYVGCLLSVGLFVPRNLLGKKLIKKLLLFIVNV